ncbi:cysteine hydrolase family protein [Paenibacillus sp. FSL H7-0716]|uniref:Cysteine hydrolase n=1 Tax=Paenibacillus odorifer TaxID=189426 RepID=A0AAD0KLA9_9BACL|nr:cysteine hydrolase family protein [Paenibacillus odorifer]AWV34521.1 cysteine hydrolase [Paenibacillus odorifer]OME21781.1 cysteine hydrolase [Paenibacillus odorifer]
MNQVLLIIDAQQELMDGNEKESAVFNKEQLIRNINKVIEQAKEANVEVVFVRDLDVAEGTGAGFQVHNKINRSVNAKIFDKLATNSFHGTELLQYLKDQQIEHVVIMGCKTQHCIDTAVRTATVSGMDVTLVGDGHSTTDNDVLSAEQIIKHHNKTLHGHYNVEHFSMVRSSEEDLFRPTHDSYR